MASTVWIRFHKVDDLRSSRDCEQFIERIESYSYELSISLLTCQWENLEIPLENLTSDNKPGYLVSASSFDGNDLHINSQSEKSTLNYVLSVRSRYTYLLFMYESLRYVFKCIVGTYTRIFILVLTTIFQELIRYWDKHW